MGLHDSFEYLKHKLWPKEELGVSQFDFRPLKVENFPDLLMCSGMLHIFENLLMRAITLF
jgi:hypothetical protein